MEQYLRKGRLSSLLDGVGLRLALLGAGLGWFFLLWGVSMPAVLAGCALGILLQLAVRQFRQRDTLRKEAVLRRRLGGELMLEDMLLAPRKQAHFQAALLLGLKYPLTMVRVTEDGMLCRSDHDDLLVCCLPLPKQCEVTLPMLTDCQRACRIRHMTRTVVCTTGRIGTAARQYADETPEPLTLIPRSALLTLAGQACPATDAQLIALGKRRKRPLPVRTLARNLLARQKAGRYWVYGTGMLLLSVVTGLGYYLMPGLVCLMLSAMSRCREKSSETL